MEWYSIKDKRPKPESIVRVYNGKISVTMMVDYNGEFTYYPGFPYKATNITHWAYEPLPGPTLQYICLIK